MLFGKAISRPQDPAVRRRALSFLCPYRGLPLLLIRLRFAALAVAITVASAGIVASAIRCCCG